MVSEIKESNRIRRLVALERAFAIMRDATQALVNAKEELRELRHSEESLFLLAGEVETKAMELRDRLRLHPERDGRDL